MSQTCRVVAIGAILLGAWLPPTGRAADWGDLRGQFLYDGEAPERVPIKITKDKDYCGKCKLFEEDLVVDPESKGVAHIIVWLYVASRDPEPPIHESYARNRDGEVILDSAKCRVDPHVCLYRTTQTLLIRNTDPIGDGLKVDTFRNDPINLVLAEGMEVRHKFPNPERMPARVSCPIHPWESGWLLVLPHPYMAATDTQGRFEIKNLPVGKWTFQFWHEKAGYLDELRQDGNPVNWKRGRAELEIKPGANDLGTFTLAPAVFTK